MSTTNAPCRQVQILKKKGFENWESMAAGMCKLWADENGVERNFA